VVLRRGDAGRRAARAADEESERPPQGRPRKAKAHHIEFVTAAPLAQIALDQRLAGPRVRTIRTRLPNGCVHFWCGTTRDRPRATSKDMPARNGVTKCVVVLKSTVLK